MLIEKRKRFPLHISTTFIALSAALLSSAIASGATLGTDTLGINELSTAVAATKKFKPKDEFDVPANASDLTGRHFLVTVKPKKRGPTNTICDGYPSWGYYLSEGKYEVGFGGTDILVKRYMNVPFAAAFPADRSLNSSFLNFVSFSCQQSKGANYRASNAFGVTTTIERKRDLVIAFSDQNKPSLTPNTERKPYWSRVIIGDAARSLSETISIRIKGIIGRWPNGQNILCGVTHSEPSLNHPYEDTLDACIYKAESLSIEVVDTRTNEVLFETNSIQN